jgi:tripartite ATP-independent transporter DctM subunit
MTMEVIIGTVLIGLMIILFLLGVPVAYSMILVGVLGIFLVRDFGMLTSIIRIAPRRTVADFNFSTLPLFIIMAMFLKNCGLISKVYRAANHWLGHLPAGLAVATALGNGVMAVLTGSSAANAASMSKIAIPEMKKYQYSETLAVGTVTAAGTFALLFPPSLALILYGILTQESIGALFIAGIIPGTLTLISYLAVIFIWYWFDPDIAGEKPEGITWNRRFRSLSSIWTALLLTVPVIGGLYSGVFTAAEAGAIGAVGALLIAIQENISTEEFIDSVGETIEFTTMIFMLIVGAIIFSRFLALTGLTTVVVDSIVGLPLGVTGTLLLLVIVFILLGTVMDQTAVLVLSLPILFPAVTELGVDPIWFGIFMVKTIEVGLITPPFGLIIFIVTSSVDTDIITAYKGALPFFVADVLIIMLLIFFPEIALYLPD